MSTILEKANQILAEKNSKILPENIKNGVTVLGVQGTLVDVAEGTVNGTITAADVISGKVGYAKGEAITGTLPLEIILSGLGNADVHVDGDNVLFRVTNESLRAIDAGCEITVAALNATVAEMIGLTSEKILAGNTIIGVEGIGTSGSALYIIPSNTSAGSTTQLEEFIGSTIGTSILIEDVETINVGDYLYMDVSCMLGEAEVTGKGILLVTEATKDEVVTSISATVLSFEQNTGLDTSDATANQGDILVGKTAYVNGEKIEGTLTIPVNPFKTLADTITLEGSTISLAVEEIPAEEGTFTEGTSYNITLSAGTQFSHDIYLYLFDADGNVIYSRDEGMLSEYKIEPIFTDYLDYTLTGTITVTRVPAYWMLGYNTMF